jgi:hypothetical protein
MLMNLTGNAATPAGTCFKLGVPVLNCPVRPRVWLSISGR